jgi:hypothetical protein
MRQRHRFADDGLVAFAARRICANGSGEQPVEVGNREASITKAS